MVISDSASLASAGTTVRFLPFSLRKLGVLDRTDVLVVFQADAIGLLAEVAKAAKAEAVKNARRALIHFHRNSGEERKRQAKTLAFLKQCIPGLSSVRCCTDAFCGDGSCTND